MATGDFAYLRADISGGVLGVPAFSSLPTIEQAQVDALINESYRECFITPDGKRPRWSEQYVSFLLKAPITLTVSLTNGAKTLGSPTTALEAAYAGSLIKIGSKYYTYAGKNVAANADYMVEPWDGATGDQVVTFYYCSYVLPLESIDLCDEPEVLGVGRLSAMTGREQEIRNRAYTTGGFEPETGGRWPMFGPGALDYQTGEPVFYFIDSASLNADGVFVARHRFTVYPLPDSVSRTVRMRANIVPAAMTNGAEIPVLPANTVTDILLPIIRMKAAMTMRRFNGTNKADLIDLGQNALRKLGTLASPQKKGRIRVAVRGNY